MNHTDRPNIVVVMVDDLGIGQCQPFAQAITCNDLDPAFLAHVRSCEGHENYEPQAALDCARMAMPTLTALAGEGVAFRRAFATSNLCAPSRVGMLTGTNQNRFGIYRNIDVNVVGTGGGEVLVQRLQAAGYRTGLIGKWHAGSRDAALRCDVLADHGLPADTPDGVLQREHPDAWQGILNSGYLGSVIGEHHPLAHGFDHYFGYNLYQCPFYGSHHIWQNHQFTGPQSRYNTDLFTDQAIAFMRDAMDRDQPFFCEVAYHAVHGPRGPQAPEAYFSRFNTGSYTLDNFFAHVYAVDEGIRRIVAALQAAGQFENTIFFFCSDNGADCGWSNPLPGNAPYRGCKGQFYQGGFHVPLIVARPDHAPSVRASDHLVSLMDILPTALEAAGLDAPVDIDGRSLLPLLADPARRWDRDHLAWIGVHSRAWGFGLRSIARGRSRDESPGAWTVVTTDHLLRFIGTTPPGLYTDAPQGIPPRLELFTAADLAEHDDRSAGAEHTVEALRSHAAVLAAHVSPPPAWDRRIWQGVIDSIRDAPSDRMT